MKRLFSVGAALVAGLLVVLPWQKLGYRLPDIVQDGLTIFLGVVIEALPFVVLGVLVSAAIRRYVTPERMQRFLPHSPVLAFPIAAFLGLLLPVCECGNMPVARRLMRQGMPPAQAITFLLAAPILNPAVILSTYAAFRFAPDLVWARFIVGFLVAVLIGLYFHFQGAKGILVEEEESGEACEHEHGGIGGIIDEFLEMMAALGFGALVAALVQILIPRAALIDLGSSAIAAIGVMMLLALIVSLCSTVDAFFALSFAGTFSAASLLAFMVIGPMVDFRAFALLSRTFTLKTIVIMTMLIAELVFLFALAIHHWGIL